MKIFFTSFLVTYITLMSSSSFSQSMIEFYGAKPDLRPLPNSEIQLYNKALALHEKEQGPAKEYIKSTFKLLSTLCPKTYDVMGNLSIKNALTTTTGARVISKIINECNISKSDKKMLGKAIEEIEIVAEIQISNETQLIEWRKKLGLN
jgi:hypothetical protein